ncbi:HlyIII-domain-containing protein [Rhizoclosmatium globosum]|uniref:HlyIII-domain-containing protein n=1 Tax=Rhizoclosmatium globosum TaxID=329046 RepID=A0A1Y2CPK7_9FUNG|nr:HlyIII-domain-containing protein [Rhizoclosmatium globosum]|eukprot:ORY48942.1 HlyIII-domain-containing protein [Rhizoclosmatium globosum]
MPSWYQGESFVNTGYRPIMPSIRDCLSSLFYLHNETGSILSHALAIPIILGLTAYTFGSVMTRPDLVGVGWQDRVVFGVLSVTNCLCLWNSATFHTFCCHSHSVNHSCLMADFVGIVINIAGCFLASMYYGFYCNKPAQLGYIVFALCFGLAAVIVNTSKRFIHHKYMGLRLGMFMVFGFSGIIPILHISIEYGIVFTQRAMGLNYIFLIAGFAVTAAIAFHYKIPERAFPNTFDIWGNSHQIMHLCTFGVMLVHYFGVLESFRFWHSLNGDCSLDARTLNLDKHDPWWFW